MLYFQKNEIVLSLLFKNKCFLIELSNVNVLFLITKFYNMFLNSLSSDKLQI